MPWTTNQASDEFGTGTTPTPSTGRENLGTIAPADQYDGSWEDYQRDAGAYQAGSMENLQDQLSQCSDDE